MRSPVSVDLRAAILAWYVERGRPLAFRRTTDPYAILVSEAMAQQTQAARAAAYWERFMERFPTVGELAGTTPAAVLRAWQGLGYDRRALALWRAARVIVNEHGGRVPMTLDELRALPGVGPYTARAVAAIAFGAPVGAVDVNVRRVLGRIVAGSPDELSPDELQATADAAVPPDRPGEWTHALMDIGATLCRPRAPRCTDCPARPWCQFAAAKARDVPVASRGSAQPKAAPGSAGRAAAFSSTTRWLRGRILDRLRLAPDGDWVELEGPIGQHDIPNVRRAATAMAADGVIELASGDDALRARLPLG
jgi:A/G-specific adenine glycosylase